MLGVGVIGAGRVSGGHARAATSIAGLKLIAVAEPDEERRTRFTERHGCEGHADHRDLLARDDIDLALLGLPHWLHAPISIDCLNAGKHAMVEKPMAITVEECDAMIEAAASNGVQLMVGHTQQFFPANLVTKELLKSGAIGEPVMADERWHKAYGIASRPPWFNDRSKGGGMWLMNGAHIVDRLMFLIESPVVAVKGMVSYKIMNLDADDGTMALLHFENGVYASVVHAGHKKPDRMMEKPGYLGEMIGSDGIIRTEPYRGNVWVMTDEEFEQVEVPRGRGMTDEVEAFVRAVEEDEPPPISNAHARDVVRVMLAVEESSRTGREVRLD